MTRPTSPFAAPPRLKPRKLKQETDEQRAERNYVRARDNGCVAARAMGLPPRLVECRGPLDVDHVRASGGLGLKSPTHRSNMVVLCRWHHTLKTEYGKTWRPLLVAYLERVER